MLEKEFLKAINENQGIILKVCRMYCADNEDAEDLFQEILLQLWKAFPRFKKEARISTWMYKIGLNTAITRLRKNSRQPGFLKLTATHELLPELETQRLDIVFDKELQHAISRLDKLDRALMMLYLDGKTYREISEILSLSESNVGVKINRIKVKLKETISR